MDINNIRKEIKHSLLPGSAEYIDLPHLISFKLGKYQCINCKEYSDLKHRTIYIAKNSIEVFNDQFINYNERYWTYINFRGIWEHRCPNQKIKPRWSWYPARLIDTNNQQLREPKVY